MNQRGDVELIKQWRSSSDRPPRKFFETPPQTSPTAQFLYTRPDGSLFFMRGCPSPLTRDEGSLFQIVQPLRQALYSKLNITTPVCEEYPVWNTTTQKVVWIEELVAPNPELIHLLDKSKVSDAFNRLFSPQPSGIVTKAIYHHLYAKWITLFDLISTATGEKLIDLLSDSIEFKSSISEHQSQIPSHLLPKLPQSKNIKCTDCGNQFIFSAQDAKWYKEKGMAEPKRCPSCRNNNKSVRGRGR